MFIRFVLAIFVCVNLFAQADRGTITGTVADPQGGVVPQAKVGLRNTQTGSQFETVTTPTGNYSLGQLPAGTYDLSVEYAGFKKFTQQGIAVQVAQTERVDVTLEVGSTADTVTITADATLLKTETAEQSYNIATERINALPLNFSARGPGSFRDPFAFVQLVPGANITDRNNIRVNGQPNATFAIRLEGQDTSRPLDPLNSDMVAPSVESLQEMSVQTSNFAAEYGQVAGGLFNFTTKSGTNQLHGSVYGYFVNEQLHAGQAFHRRQAEQPRPCAKHPRCPMSSNLFPNPGGPIVREERGVRGWCVWPARCANGSAIFHTTGRVRRDGVKPLENP